MSESRKCAELMVFLVDEWPLGPPRYPVKKAVCGKCGKPVWLELKPSYLFLLEHGVGMVLVCQKCVLNSIVRE
jgi:hypothetical protein